MQSVFTNEAALAGDRGQTDGLAARNMDSFEDSDRYEDRFGERAGDGREGVDGQSSASSRPPKKTGDTGDIGNIPPCPKCGAEMEPIRHEGEIIFFGCTQFKKTGCRGKWFKDRTSKDEKPWFKSCPECHQGLKRGFGRNGQPYCACFEADDHESRAPIFFTHDGKPKPRLVPKGDFRCPECDGRLSYFQVQNGLYSGRRTFACFNADKHASKRAHYWEDQNGKPSW